jgi:hypothetical protein
VQPSIGLDCVNGVRWGMRDGREEKEMEGRTVRRETGALGQRRRRGGLGRC